jgi:hypothetical protein
MMTKCKTCDATIVHFDTERPIQCSDCRRDRPLTPTTEVRVDQNQFQQIKGTINEKPLPPE